MDGQDAGFWEWAFKGIVGGVFIIGGWLWNNLVAAVKQNRTETEKVSDDLSAHKLYVAQTLPTKAEVNQAIFETKETVKRIHERLDLISDRFMGNK